MKTRLKLYLKEHFSFRDLRKVGFFSKDIKEKDYEKQAERICTHFGLKNIYDYSRYGAGTRYHLTEDGGPTSLTFASTIKDTFGQDILKSVNPH